jgi:hypothetical protein
MESTTSEIQLGRDLESRHLVIVGESESEGHSDIASKANLLWFDHEAGLADLERELEGRRRCR